MLVIGDKEVEEGTVSVHSRKVRGDLGGMPVGSFYQNSSEIATKSKIIKNRMNVFIRFFLIMVMYASCG